MLRAADQPFAPAGGLRMLSGRLGRAVIKTSAVKPEHRVVTAPAMVFDDQADFLAAFAEGRLDGRDLVAVVRYQGPAANGMPELHKLMPALGVLQDRGLVTVDADAGLLEVELSDAEFQRREATGRAPHDVEWAGTGRELFAGFRAIVGTAETGASVIRPLPPPTEEAPGVQPV